MSVRELLRAGLGLCDEIDKLLLEGKTDQALVPVADLGKLLDVFAEDKPNLQRTLSDLLDHIFANTYEGDVRRAALWFMGHSVASRRRTRGRCSSPEPT